MQRFLRIFAFSLLALGLGFSAPRSAHALSFGDLQDLSGMSQDDMDNLLAAIGEGAAYKGYTGASPLGMAIGLEVGVEGTIITPSDDFETVYKAITGKDSPSILPVPRFGITKGLPMNIDLGFAFLSSGIISSWTLSAKWTPISIPGALNVAGRLSYTNNDVAFFSSSTFGIDAMASMAFPVFEPYLGVGLDLTSATLDVDGASGSLSSSVDADTSFTGAKLFFGFALKLAILKIVPQYDLNSTGNNSFGVRVALSF